jgi:choice-of-anchor C domain-containing protein
VPVIYIGVDGHLRACHWWRSVDPVTSPAPVTDNLPHHVAITYDLTTFRAYLDAVLIGEQTTSLTNYATSMSYQLGTGKTASGWPSASGTDWMSFAGHIDEIRAWTTARTPSEICAGMHQPLTGSEPGLIGYWRLDEGQDQNITDLSPGGNHGVLGANANPEGDASDPIWVAADFFPGVPAGLDGDNDGVSSVCDNCLEAPNADQANGDGDASGDACELDDDDDGALDAEDTCPTVANPDQNDADTDGFGDACDNCPESYNSSQADEDGDGIGDACDPRFDAPLVNGSFDVGMPGGADWYVTLPEGSTAVTRWVVSRGDVDYMGTWLTSSDGVRSIDLDGSQPGGIAQTVITAPGQTYVLEFDLAANPAGGPSVKRMRIEAAGQSAEFTADITEHSRLNVGWQTLAWAFQAAAEETTIEFYSLDAVGSTHGPLIDRVRLLKATVLSDLDRDGDVDEDDRGRLQACWRDAGTPPSFECERADLDQDGDVDDADLAILEACFSGAGMAASAGCEDVDLDSVRNPSDNCPATVNPDQADSDADGLGDHCDNCPAVANPDQADTDGDGLGDACQPDCNGNGILDEQDLAAGTSTDCNVSQIPDECEFEGEFTAISEQIRPFGGELPQSFRIPAAPAARGDVTLSFWAIGDLSSTSEYLKIYLEDVAIGTIFGSGAQDCPYAPDVATLVVPAATFNAVLAGADPHIHVIASADVDPVLCAGTSSLTIAARYRAVIHDCDVNQVLDLCDPDADEDDVIDACDNCPLAANADQADGDGDAVGNTCDNCPEDSNASQLDADTDEIGDACDNCPALANADQADADQDGVGDVCDRCPDTPPGVEVGETGCPTTIPGDFDQDGDVDQEDFGFFQICLSGSGIEQLTPGCERARLDEDLDVDQVDFALFQGCVTGPNGIGDLNCAD